MALEPGKPVTLVLVDIAPPSRGEVRVRIVATSICHTDLHSLDGHIAEVHPIIYGHECAGVVESIGEDVTSVQVGDHVVPACIAQCKQCKGCGIPENNVCEKLK